jgi:dihydroflavonol-4-reductase
MILITGATGLIGSHLVCRLVSGGQNVRILIRDPARLGVLERVFGYYGASFNEFCDNISVVQGDLLDPDTLDAALVGVKQVYNCAAIVSFDPSEREWLIRHNIDATANLVNACLEHGIRKLAHVSSTSAIGKETKEQFLTEETEWKFNKNLTGYAISKYESEREVWRGDAEGLPVVIVNPAMVVGPGNWGESSTALIDKCYKGLGFYTAGVNAWVDVRDVADALVLLMESTIDGARFILAGENMEFRKFFGMVCGALGVPAPRRKAGKLLAEMVWRAEWLRSRVTGKKPLITRETARTSRSKDYYSSQKIQKTLGFTFRPMRETIEWTCRHYLSDLNKPATNPDLSSGQ